MELSSIVRDGTLGMEVDNPVTQTNVTLMNVDNRQLEADAGLYLPGSKLRVGLYMGESNRIPMAIHRVDDVDYSVISDSVSLSARNSIGFLLRDQTLGDNTVWSGSSSDIIEVRLFYRLCGRQRR
ncbi:MAG: hypothetical protein HUJ69_01375 [Lachnospiraceae bacterium]|nr:hypothetical protein [Lachnospiraceae bacterium]